MRVLALLTPLCCLLACASVTGTQTFQSSSQYSLPTIGNVTGTRTIAASAATNARSFAESVLQDVDELRENKHVDSAAVAVRIASVQLTSNTTFAGVKAVRLQLVTETETIELCNRPVTTREEQSSSISCTVDHEIQESELKKSSDSATPAQISVQLQVSGAVTATKLTATVAFDVEVNADVSL
jgi:hypothetical protein